MVQQREQRYPILKLDNQDLSLSDIQQVVVLGAGHSNAPGYPVHTRLSEPALKRLLEGVRVHKALSTTKLVCSGYSSTGRQSQAEALAEMAIELGVLPGDTLLQPLAVNTEAEARTFTQRFGKGNQLVLVTSALHLPRAMFWFEHFGQNPIPAPTNHLVMPDPGYEPFAWKPSLRKIEMTQKLLHEYAGMLYAKFKVGKQR
ncbi:MAG: YdcF family protein [Bacteroidota bacterium]